MGEDHEQNDVSTSSTSRGDSNFEGEKSRSCRGCLLYSSSLRDARRNPICIGLGRSEQRVYSLIGESEQDATKEGRRLADFKYACIGYSIHKETAATSGGAIEGAELPLCVGVEVTRVNWKQRLEQRPSLVNVHFTYELSSAALGTLFLADRRPQAADSPSTLEQLEQDEGGPSNMPRPPSTMKQPPTIGGMSSNEFASRFVRCAGLVATAVVRNLSQVVVSVKTGLDDMIHERRRPK